MVTAIKPWFLTSPRYASLSLTSSFTQYHTLHLIRDMKQWMSFIPTHHSDSSAAEGSTDLISQIPSYELPDRTLVHPSPSLCFAANQTFFGTTRQKIDLNAPQPPIDDINSLPHMIWNVILRSDVDIRREMLGNVIPVGGGSLIDGMAQRLSNELSILAPSSIKVKVVNNSGAPVEKQHAAWIGGSVLSICGSFQQLWISRQEYDEHGPKVYLRKSQH
jgi:actin, other eukaryote